MGSWRGSTASSYVLAAPSRTCVCLTPSVCPCVGVRTGALRNTCRPCLVQPLEVNINIQSSHTMGIRLERQSSHTAAAVFLCLDTECPSPSVPVRVSHVCAHTLETRAHTGDWYAQLPAAERPRVYISGTACCRPFLHSPCPSFISSMPLLTQPSSGGLPCRCRRHRGHRLHRGRCRRRPPPLSPTSSPSCRRVGTSWKSLLLTLG